MVELIQKGDDGLLPKLWEQVRRFIVMKARQFYNQLSAEGRTYGCELDDLVQSGYLGLEAAVRYFKPEMGYTFLTYLSHTLETAFYDALGLRSSKRDWLNYAVSLDKPVDESGDTSLLEMLGDMTPEYANVTEQIVENVWNQELRAALDEAMVVLNTGQRELINMVYFFDVPITEVAEMRGVTRQNIHNLHQKALRVLRGNKELQGFRPAYKRDPYSKTGYRAWSERQCSVSESFLVL